MVLVTDPVSATVVATYMAPGGNYMELKEFITGTPVAGYEYAGRLSSSGSGEGSGYGYRDCYGYGSDRGYQYGRR